MDEYKLRIAGGFIFQHSSLNCRISTQLNMYFIFTHTYVNVLPVLNVKQKNNADNF